MRHDLSYTRTREKRSGAIDDGVASRLVPVVGGIGEYIVNCASWRARKLKRCWKKMSLEEGQWHEKERLPALQDDQGGKWQGIRQVPWL
jgi:hypothetical protein